jgi:hypothetical protein
MACKDRYSIWCSATARDDGGAARRRFRISAWAGNRKIGQRYRGKVIDRENSMLIQRHCGVADHDDPRSQLRLFDPMTLLLDAYLRRALTWSSSSFSM